MKADKARKIANEGSGFRKWFHGFKKTNWFIDKLNTMHKMMKKEIVEEANKGNYSATVAYLLSTDWDTYDGEERDIFLLIEGLEERVREDGYSFSVTSKRNSIGDIECVFNVRW